MTTRTAIKDDLVAKLTGANPGVPVEKWDGEEAVFNNAHAWPSMYVAYAGTEFGDQQEVGDDQATYGRNHVFQVFVCTANENNGAAGDDQAMDIMEASETAAAGNIIASLGQAEIIGEEMVHVHMGRFLYVQTWKITLLESH